MKKVYAITGAGGFLGNTLVRRLVASGCEVRALVLPGDPCPSLQGVDCQRYAGDVTQPETLKDFFETGPQEELVVIHCAAIVYIKSKPNPQVFRVNVDGTANIIQKCLETNAKLIYLNTVHTLPEPEDDSVIVETDHFSEEGVVGLYAESKAKAAQLVLDAVRHQGLRAVIIQPSGIIGPGDYGATHMTGLIRAATRGRLPAIVKGGYDFVDVRDVVQGILSAVDKGRDGECYILSNRYVTIKEMVDLACGYAGAKKIRVTLPLWVAKCVAPLCELYSTLKKQVPLFTRYSLYTLQAKSHFSHEKADRELGYTTRTLEETISDTAEWLSQMK